LIFEIIYVGGEWGVGSREQGIRLFELYRAFLEIKY